MAVFIKETNNEYWSGFGAGDGGEKGTLTHCWWEYTLVQPLWKSVYRFLKKQKLGLPYDPVISFLGIYPKEYKSTYNNDNWS
jgi:hypothetical protein